MIIALFSVVVSCMQLECTVVDVLRAGSEIRNHHFLSNMTLCSPCSLPTLRAENPNCHIRQVTTNKVVPQQLPCWLQTSMFGTKARTLIIVLTTPVTEDTANSVQRYLTG